MNYIYSGKTRESHLSIVLPALSNIFTTFDKSRWGETGWLALVEWVVARRWIGAGSLSHWFWPSGCCSLTESSSLSLDARRKNFFVSRLFDWLINWRYLICRRYSAHNSLGGNRCNLIEILLTWAKARVEHIKRYIFLYYCFWSEIESRTLKHMEINQPRSVLCRGVASELWNISHFYLWFYIFSENLSFHAATLVLQLSTRYF